VTRSGCAEALVAVADMVEVPEEVVVSVGIDFAEMLDDAEGLRVNTGLLDAAVSLLLMLILIVVPLMAAFETETEVITESVELLPALGMLPDITL